MGRAMSERTPAVLVVDDIEDNRYTLIRRLKRQGIEDITEAADGRQALALLNERPFDLVLLDIMMPEINGHDVLREIKADMSLRDIPVIMISAVDEIETVIACIEAGAEDFLQKPFDSTLLKARVAASLEKKRLRDQEAEFLAQLRDERKRADDLLHAVLPPGAIKELQATDTVAPRRYENVAVLFCDIVGFTPYCEANPPEDVVPALQRLIERFEELAAEEGLEKIKTVGDAFLATGNLLERLDEPVAAAVRCALKMVDASTGIDPGWTVRAGIHFGPVVAGIVGRRQFLFDLWGDTVNTAARVLDHAPPGAVVVCNETWLHAREVCRGRSLGTVELKGKGEVELIQCTAP